MILALSEVALKLSETQKIAFSEINRLIMPQNLLEKSKEFKISQAKIEQSPLRVDTLQEKIELELGDYKRIEKVKGDISENMMDWYFKNSKWEKLEGEVGSNGIDGLYVKRDKDGNIKDVMVVESKYNKSKLGDTLNGKQMSKEWVEAKLNELEKANPENKDYPQVKNHIENGNYRARLWQMKEIDGNLEIKISEVLSDGNKVELSDLKGSSDYKINKFQSINLENPEGKYQQKVSDSYKEIVETQIEKAKGKIDENKTNIAA